MGQDKKAVFDMFRQVLTCFNKFEHVFSSSFRQGKIGQLFSVLKKCIKKEQKKMMASLAKKQKEGYNWTSLFVNIYFVCLFLHPRQ